MTDVQIDIVWAKGIVVDGFDPSMFRKDPCGAWISRAEYSNHDSDYGWDVDHIYPKALGGDDAEINLRPMQWQNNFSKGIDFPYYYSATSAKGRENVPYVNQYKLNDKLYNALKQQYNF